MKNKFTVRDDGTVEIMLTQGKVALIDEDDMPLVEAHKWYADKNRRTFYAVRNAIIGNGKRSLLKMHRVILGPSAGYECDHVNGDGLDNRRVNLRVCTSLENRHNRRPQQQVTSAYKGVSWDKHAGKWRARIHINGKLRYLGRFANERDAASAYDAVACRHFGEFARPNFGALSTGS